MGYRQRFVVSVMSVVLALVLPFSLTARELAGVQLQEQVELPGAETILQLNGAGIRYKFFFKVYVGALYLPVKMRSAEQVLSTDQPARVLMHIVYDEVPLEKLTAAWNEGFSGNVPADRLASLKSRLNTFNNMFSDLHAGDVVLLDYMPGQGTRVTIRGEDRGLIEGADFNRALLSVWLGDEPVTDELKDAMLGIVEE